VPSRLVVERIQVDRFGGLADRGVVLPDAPFVVLSGANETGKSTLVELLSWLLVGPVGGAGEAQRFGAVGASVGGSVRGRLDGPTGGATGVDVECFEVIGSFRVPARGSPNTAGLRVHLGADGAGPAALVQLDLESWRTRLGGVDAVVFDAIYRLRGEQLHDGGGVETHLSQVALAGLAGRVDPRELVTDFSDAVRRLTVTRAAGVETVTTLGARLTELRRALDEAGTTAAEHTRVRAERAEVEAERERRRGERDGLRARRAAAQVLLDAGEAAREVERLEQLLRAAPTIPAPWVSLAADPGALAAAVAAAEEAEALATSASRSLTVTGEELGQPTDRLAALALDDAALAELARRTEVLRAADDALVEARARAEEADAAVVRTSALLDRTLLDPVFRSASSEKVSGGVLGGASGGVPDASPGGVSDAWSDGAPHGGLPSARAALAGARLDPGSRSSARVAIEQWTRQLDACAVEDRRLDDACRTAEAATARRRLETEAWDRLGTGRSAADWLAPASGGRDGAPGVGSIGRGDRWPWLLPGALALVALVAGLAGERWSAAVAATAAVLTAILVVLVPRRPRPEVGLVEPPPGDGTATWFELARGVIEAESIERQRLADLAAVEAARRQAGAEADRARAAADAVLAGLGLPIADTPATALAVVESWAAAAELLDREEQARETLDDERRRALRAAEAVATAETDLRALVGRIGLGDDLPLRSVAALAPRLRAGATLAREVTRLREDAARSRRTAEELLAPVAAETAAWRSARIVDRAEQLHEADRTRAGLEADLRERRTELDLRLGADPEVRALAAEAPSPAVLAGMVEDLGREETIAERAVQESSELVGRLDARLRELEHTDRIVELSAELGTVQERRVEVAVEAASRALAAGLLATVTEEHERAHQPAIVGRADELARAVAPTWDQVRVRAAGPGHGLQVEVHQRGGTAVPATRLSTGARALLYLSFRIALAEHDAARRGVCLPLLCDDPLVHVDDQRAEQVAQLLAAAADRGHQVLLFTCHDRTVEVARRAGAVHVALDGTDRADRADRADQAPTTRLLHQSP
jgi:hypothetical protein